MDLPTIAIIIIAIVVILAIIIKFGRNMKISEKKSIEIRWVYVSFVLGILLCLIGAFLMFEAHILGESARGWAPVIGIVGIGFIGTSGAIAAARASLKPKN